MNPIKIIQKYYDKNSKLYAILIEHSQAVTKKALDIATRVQELNPDINFIQEASMLHDIGIYLTIEYLGKEPYIRHGILGRQILDKEGFPKHGLVCERHIGTGLSIEDIKQQKLPLPRRDMLQYLLKKKLSVLLISFFQKT